MLSVWTTAEVEEGQVYKSVLEVLERAKPLFLNVFAIVYPPKTIAIAVAVPAASTCKLVWVTETFDTDITFADNVPIVFRFAEAAK